MFILIGMSFLVLTSIGDSYYRDWVYANQIADFGLADYLPSITGTITSIFLLIGLAKDWITKAPESALWITCGCATYECLQPVVGTGVFDPQDFIAVFVTGGIVVFMLNKVNASILRTVEHQA
ncbi:hypothetical protein [Rheinheimera sp. UJ63]|uniref:hypothetical protein n=1 Tax=Rheinheimera sp. UJ63 TaxID=2910157 RepID=UPI001F39D052|nr:hypothetical protein [Rheinheimera sp. UJ63]MCF4009702.1 hypothetical protein [Rheinheimera sp. UJ63]